MSCGKKVTIEGDTNPPKILKETLVCVNKSSVSSSGDTNPPKTLKEIRAELDRRMKEAVMKSIGTDGFVKPEFVGTHNEPSVKV